MSPSSCFLSSLPGPEVACGAPNDQRCMKLQCADGGMVHLALQRVERAFSKLDAVLTDGGQRRPCDAAQGNVVKADDAEIIRDPDIQLRAVGQDSLGEQIVIAQNGRASQRHQPWKLLLNALAGQESHPHGRIRHAEARHRVREGDLPLLIDKGLRGAAAEIADLPVTQTLEVSDRESHCFKIIHTHIGYKGILVGRVVEQDGRCLALLDRSDPGI